MNLTNKPGGDFVLDTSEFQRQIRAHLAHTSRELHRAINSRMFYWLLRSFAILPPKDPEAAKAKVRDYMKHQISSRGSVGANGKFKRHKASKQLQRRHLIAQAKNKRSGGKGLYGKRMSDAAASVLRRAVSSVGYLKSPLVKAMRSINGHFTQFGKKRKKGKDVPPNAALQRIAAEYGLSIGSNIGIHKGAKAKARLAAPGFSPSAVVRISSGVDDGQSGTVNAHYNHAFQQAAFDESAELRRHVAEVVQDSVDQQFKR